MSLGLTVSGWQLAVFNGWALAGHIGGFNARDQFRNGTYATYETYEGGSRQL
jgi:hypothetical protein